MEQLRAKKGIEINVNDEGDVIVIDIENIDFVTRAKAVLNKLEHIADDIDTDKEYTENEAINTLTDKMKEIMAELDKIMGEGACEKIFGKDFIPTPMPVIELMEDLIPIVKKYMTEREAKISKYAPRKGGKHRV